MLIGVIPLSCTEMRTSRVAVTTSPVSKMAANKNNGTSNTRARAKVDTGRSHKITRQVQVSRAKAVLVGRSKVRIADFLGAATSVANRAIQQQTAPREENCKP